MGTFTTSKTANIFRNNRPEVSFKIVALVQNNYFMKSDSTMDIFMEGFQ